MDLGLLLERLEDLLADETSRGRILAGDEVAVDDDLLTPQLVSLDVLATELYDLVLKQEGDILQIE